VVRIITRADLKQASIGRAGLRNRQPGNRVFIGTACPKPIILVEALERSKPTPPDVELFHFLTSGLALLRVERPSAYRHRCFFVGSDVRPLVHNGQAEYVPISLTQIPHLMANGRLRADVAFVQVSPPATRMASSVSASRSISPRACCAMPETIVAEINPFMPRTLGDTFLHVDQIDHFVRAERPLIEYAHQPADAVAERIARYVAEIIEDGATLHVDLGRIPNETLKHLHHRRDLGIYRTSSPTPVLDLVEQG
jgi:acyl-CoA hydrolase